jgi:hypothetical protein
MFNAIAEKPTCDESMKHNTPQIICDQTHLKLCLYKSQNISNLGLSSYILWFQSIIVAKNMYITMHKKNVIIFKKWLKWFLTFMKFAVSIKHCDSIWLE